MQMNKIIYKPIKSLIPYVNDERYKKSEKINQIIDSIQEFGFTNPVLIDENNVIISGHYLVLAAQSMGLNEVPTLLVNSKKK